MPIPAPQYPGAVAPERTRFVHADGVELHVHEWGDPEAVPVVCCHGMFDHGRGFDCLAPLLSDRFRIIALDARGHGDSSWSHAYNWPIDLMDIGYVLRDLGRPAHLIGHSKGGGQVTDAATIFRDAVRQIVNIDGFGPPDDAGFGPPQMTSGATTVPERFTIFLDRRRRTARDRRWRVYPDLDDLVERRRAQNPRLSKPWLRYFAYHGARQVENGWIWKVDPLIATGFGPFKPQWIGPNWKHLRAPMLAMIGSEPDTWGPIPEPTRLKRLSHVPQVEHAVIQDAGHFSHMEQPQAVADVVLAFLERG